MVKAIKMNGRGSDGDDGKYVHIPAPSILGSQTICGFVDCVGAEEIEVSSPRKITCPSCRAVLAIAKKYTK